MEEQINPDENFSQEDNNNGNVGKEVDAEKTDSDDFTADDIAIPNPSGVAENDEDHTTGLKNEGEKMVIVNDSELIGHTPDTNHKIDDYYKTGNLNQTQSDQISHAENTGGTSAED